MCSKISNSVYLEFKTQAKLLGIYEYACNNVFQLAIFLLQKQCYAQELEESRASWNVVKAKTAESEEQWVKLKADFAERKRFPILLLH